MLKENDAHATFFEIGNQVAENADVVKRIAAEGNQIGSHTWDHASGSGQGVNLTFMTADEQRDEVTKGFSAIEDVLGTSVPHVLRAPGGNYYGSLVENLKDLVDVEVGWNVDTEDWRRPGADKIAEAIMSAQPGNVVLMHDGGGDRLPDGRGAQDRPAQAQGRGLQLRHDRRAHEHVRLVGLGQQLADALGSRPPWAPGPLFVGGSAHMPRETNAAKRARAIEFCERLDAMYGPVECFLDHGSPFRLVISVLLSAQTTDAQVNKVTPELFGRWPTPADLAAATPGRWPRSSGAWASTRARRAMPSRPRG